MNYHGDWGRENWSMKNEIAAQKREIQRLDEEIDNKDMELFYLRLAVTILVLVLIVSLLWR